MAVPSPCLSCSPRDRPVTQETVEPAPSAEPDALGKRRRLSPSAAIFGVATGLSRVLGLVREIVARNYFGVPGDINAFTVAFQVPNLDSGARRRHGLHVGVRARVQRAAGRRASGAVHGRSPRASSGSCCSVWAGSPRSACSSRRSSWRRSGCRSATRTSTVTLSRILFPIVTLLGVSGVFVGLLNSYEQFTIPALTPVVVEPRDHRRARDRRAARRLGGRRSSTSTPARSSSAR